jgi:hypothetical protein
VASYRASQSLKRVSDPSSLPTPVLNIFLRRHCTGFGDYSTQMDFIQKWVSLLSRYLAFFLGIDVLVPPSAIRPRVSRHSVFRFSDASTSHTVLTGVKKPLRALAHG